MRPDDEDESSYDPTDFYSWLSTQPRAKVRKTEDSSFYEKWLMEKVTQEVGAILIQQRSTQICAAVRNFVSAFRKTSDNLLSPEDWSRIEAATTPTHTPSTRFMPRCPSPASQRQAHGLKNSQSSKGSADLQEALKAANKRILSLEMSCRTMALGLQWMAGKIRLLLTLEARQHLVGHEFCHKCEDPQFKRLCLSIAEQSLSLVEAEHQSTNR